MGKLKKIIKKIDPIGGKSLEAIGVLPKDQAAPGAAAGPTPAEQAALDAQARATEEANRIAAEQLRYQQELNNMNKNYAADLSNENRAMVETAGTANEAGQLDNPDQKRRRASSGLASTLGINV